ncbi:hypothetical protein ICW40_20140, partial [Actinotalea ferrariae]|uniref:hypothetical protein n=1 Tax=Actinotalea ferrariae TaxID=1386098 RepID=UPI001C8B540C
PGLAPAAEASTPDRGRHGPGGLLALQATAGNAAVARLVAGSGPGTSPHTFTEIPLGRVTLLGLSPLPFGDIELRARAEVPGGEAGYPSVAAAGAEAARRRTIQAVVRDRHGRLHLYDTLTALPPTASMATGVQVLAYARQDLELVQWFGLPLPPRAADPLEDVSLPSLSDGNPIDTRSTPTARLSAYVAAFRRRNRGLDDDTLRIETAVQQVAYPNLEVAIAWFRHYSTHSLAVRSIRPLAETSGGDTVVRPDVARDSTVFPVHRLGGVLLHELTHTHDDVTAGFSIANADNGPEEGKAYGVEAFYAVQSGDVHRLRGIGQVVRIGAGEISESHLPQFGRVFNETVALMFLLQRIVDERVPESYPPLGLAPPPTPAEARLMMAELIPSSRPGPRLAALQDYVRTNVRRLPRLVFASGTFDPSVADAS